MSGTSVIVRTPDDKLLNIPASYKIIDKDRTKQEIYDIWNSYNFDSINDIKIGSFVSFKEHFGSNIIDSTCKYKVDSIETWIIPKNYNCCQKYKASEHTKIIFQLGLKESSEFSIEENMKDVQSDIDYSTALMIELSYIDFKGKTHQIKRYINENGPFEIVNFDYLEEIIEKIDIFEGRETYKERKKSISNNNQFISSKEISFLKKEFQKHGHLSYSSFGQFVDNYRY